MINCCIKITMYDLVEQYVKQENSCRNSGHNLNVIHICLGFSHVMSGYSTETRNCVTGRLTQMEVYLACAKPRVQPSKTGWRRGIGGREGEMEGEERD